MASLLASYKKPEDLIGENGLLKQLTKLLVERALDAELTEHLGHERNGQKKRLCHKSVLMTGTPMASSKSWRGFAAPPVRSKNRNHAR